MPPARPMQYRTVGLQYIQNSLAQTIYIDLFGLFKSDSHASNDSNRFHIIYGCPQEVELLRFSLI